MQPIIGYRRLFFPIGLVLASGCGLSEYQSKYEKQQERINYLDQENQYLGKNIEPSGKVDSKDPPFPIYLRLPLGISIHGEEKSEGILCRYPTTLAKPPKDSDVKYSEIDSAYLAVGTATDWNDFLKKSMESFKGIDPLKAGRIELEAPGRSLREFRTISFTEGADPTWSYQFFFFRDNEYRVAIGFRGSEKTMSSETAKKAMEFSMRSLAVGKAAESLLRKSSSE